MPHRAAAREADEKAQRVLLKTAHLGLAAEQIRLGGLLSHGGPRIPGPQKAL